MDSPLQGEWDGGVGVERRARLVCAFPGIELAFGHPWALIPQG